MGAVGGLGAKPGPEIQELLEEEVTAFLGRAKSALIRLGQRYRLSERIRSPEAYAGNDTAGGRESAMSSSKPAAAAVRQQDQEGC